MADILSQSEIDALLSALSSDGAQEVIISGPQAKIRAYDFRRPNKFSKAQLTSLINIYEQFSRSLANYLSGNLHTVVDAKVLTAEQVTFDEFTRSLPYPSILGIFSMTPLEGSALIELAPALAFIMVERLLGGSGFGAVRNRDLTEIEQKIITSRLQKVVGLMEEAWGETYSLRPQFLVTETNPQFAQIVAPNEMVVVIIIEVKIAESTGVINICLPYIVMKPILDKLNTLLLFSSEEEKLSEEELGFVRQNIEQAKVPFKAYIGQANITVQDLLTLERGDVIPLDKHIRELLPVFVGDFKKFRAAPGLSGNRLAVQIAEIIYEGGDSDE